jgi:hypothetical protein
VTIVATAARGGEFLPLANFPDPESEMSRCLLLEVISNSSGLKLKKLGQWELEGPAVASSLYAEIDGKLSSLVSMPAEIF